VVFSLKDKAQQGLDIVHERKEGWVQVAEQGSREGTQNSRMHHTRPWAKEQPAWGDEVFQRHCTPNLVHFVSLVSLVCLVE
jgi:hypothetical protein